MPTTTTAADTKFIPFSVKVEIPDVDSDQHSHSTSNTEFMDMEIPIEENNINKNHLNTDGNQLKTEEPAPQKSVQHIVSTWASSSSQVMNKNSKIYKCNVCFKTFPNTSNLRKHERLQHLCGHPGIICEICLKSIKTKKLWRNHMLLVHNQTVDSVIWFECSLCTHKVLSKRALELHIVNKHVVDKPFPCHVCSKNFIDEETMKSHMKHHSKEPKYFCDICSRGFIVKRSLGYHLGVVHRKFFYCEKCRKSYTNKFEFDQHLITEIGLEFNSKFQCQIETCRQLCVSQCNLNIHNHGHLKLKETDTETNTEAEVMTIVKDPAAADVNTAIQETEAGIIAKAKTEEFKCELCSKTFDRKAYIVAHRNLVHPNSTWKCSHENCSKSFKMHNQLKMHKLTHLKTKPHVCQICQKSFCRPTVLKIHEQVHSLEKLHKCKLCSKTFSCLSNLKRHTARCHSGRKPFKCHICGLSWVLQSDLNAHLLSHTTERSFKCDICPKAFKHKKHLLFHSRNVHENPLKIKGISKRKPNSKYSDAAVYVCCSQICHFETGSQKEVAMHYHDKHELPRVQIVIQKSNVSASFYKLEEMDETRNKSSIKYKLIQKRFKCKVCSKLFVLTSSLKAHLLTHSEKNPFKCRLCSKSFSKAFNLKRHLARCM